MKALSPHDSAAAQQALADLAEKAPDLAFDASLMAPILGASPYLRSLCLKFPEFSARLASENLESLFAELLAELDHRTDEDQIRARIRQVKARAALLIAFADVTGHWPVMKVTAHLTKLADHLLQTAVNHLLLDFQRMGKLKGLAEENPSLNSGYVVLAMGKHGAGELNYSSDIDLIILYDAESQSLHENTEPSECFVRLTRRLVSILQEIDVNGYGFRVDLRLRPDPRATQIAISMEAASVYYESMGQNWERAAMIKARPAAGDLALGDEFLSRLKPYVWRKYLDFAAIADVQSLKRQIHAVKGHGEIAVYGHNLKLGRGGIREIEFFVQTQQLIAGGRNPDLRGRETLAMLKALAAHNWITPQACEELTREYEFLRSIEHRVQMIDDEQTHALPAQGEAFDNLARFAGFADANSFATRLLAAFTCVQGHYDQLFEGAEGLGAEAGSLVFTGGEDDPETLQSLSRMGFAKPSDISSGVRSWHFGRYGAMRSAKSRELLTEIMPALLQALASTGDADQAFWAFDRFLSRLPAGVQLFSLLRANPKLLDLIATILGTAPRLEQQLSQRPQVLDAVLDPGFFGTLPSAEELEARIAAQIPPATPQEEVLDRARILGREQMFRIGVRVISDTVSAGEAGLAWSNLADSLIIRLFAQAQAELITRHGLVPDGEAIVIAMGKLGGREMTASSDLDLMVIYRANPDAEASDGEKPLSLDQYFGRLTQRMIAGLSVPTAEGGLYEVDMRLRPSGNKGPVATRLDSFLSYHQGSAWTWEKMALTRARIVAGSPSLMKDVRQAIREVLCTPRDRQATLKDVADMRALMRRELGSLYPWDLKHVPGGLVDVEFIAQALSIIHAHDHPEILSMNTGETLSLLAHAGLLAKADVEILLRANGLYHRLTQVLRLCVDGPFKPDQVPLGLKAIIASAAGEPDLIRAESLLREVQAQVLEIHTRIIG